MYSLSNVSVYIQVVCVGSVEELERLSNVRGVADLHREFVDNITIPSQVLSVLALLVQKYKY
jgi:hypothetical protein